MSYTDVENVYREFITEAKKLHDEIMKMNNEIRNPFRELESLLADELAIPSCERRYQDWKDKIALEFLVAVREQELYCCKLLDDWCILPLNPKVLPYGYGWEFDTLVDMLTDGKLMYVTDDDDYGTYKLEEYMRHKNVSKREAIELFTTAIDRINHIRKDKLKAVDELAADLREHFSACALLEDCKSFISR